MISDDEPRCLDDGCPERTNCARWIERDRHGPLTKIHISLFPYDRPLDDPCPLRLEPTGEVCD